MRLTTGTELRQGERKLPNDDANKTSSPSVFGILERAWDFQWALRLICAVMFIDMAMMIRVGHGLCQWTTGDRELLSNVGWIALTLVAFSFAAAIVMPVFLFVLRQIIDPVGDWLSAFFTSQDDRSYQRPLGCVTTYELRKLALNEKDGFLFRLYETDKEKKDANRQAQEHFADLAAAMLFFTLADWILAYWIPDSVGLIGAIADALGDWAYIVTVVVLLYFFGILKSTWFPSYSPDLIYYPPLDRELRNKEKNDKL